MLRTHRREPDMEGTEGLDAGGRVNRRLFSEILRYMDLAREFNIVFLAVVHDDYHKPIYFDRSNYSKFTRSAFAGVDLDALPPHQRRFVRDGTLLRDVAWKYTAPDAIACQDMYARELTRFLRNCPATLRVRIGERDGQLPGRLGKPRHRSAARRRPRSSGLCQPRWRRLDDRRPVVVAQ